MFLWNWYSFCGGCDRWQFDRGLKGAATGDGKTEFIAAIACLEFAGPPQIAVPSPNIPISAASFEQANLLFAAAATMLGGRDQSVPEAPLCGYFNVYDTEITFADGRPGKMHRLAAAAGTNEGGLPSLFICDELHEWGALGSNKARVHVVVNKSTRKRNTPRGAGRNLNLSTAGFDVDNTLLGAIYKHGKRVLHDPSVDPRFLMDWREADESLDLKDPAQREVAVRQASMAAGVIWNVADRVRSWDDPAMQHHEWIRYFANRWVDMAEESWLADDPGAWEDCRDPEVTIPEKAPVVLAVDMSLKRDCTAVMTLHRLDDDRIVIRCKIWKPDDRKIDHLAVMQHIRDQAAIFDVTEVTYDIKFFEVPAGLLEEEGFNMVEFPQSPERMAPACGMTLEMIRARKIVHDGDPELGAHVKAAEKRVTEGGFTLSKALGYRRGRHIDGAVALCIGVRRLMAPDLDDEMVPMVAFV